MLVECDRVLNYGQQNPAVLYMRSKALTGMKMYGPALSVYRSARALLPRAQAFVAASTALAIGRRGHRRNNACSKVPI